MLLQGTLAELQKGSEGVAAGVGGLASSAAGVSESAKELSAQLTVVNKGQKSLQSGMNQLVAGASELKSGTEAISSGGKQLNEAMLFFNGKISEAAQGSNQLVAGVQELTQGTSQLATGSEEIVSGADQLADGSEKLSEGTIELHEGTSELASGLAEGAADASEVSSDEGTYQMIAKPVEVHEEKLNEVPNYGTGFAPYFLSFGLFVGALLLSIVFPLIEPMAVPRSGFNWFMSKFVVLVGIGIIQALLSVAILLYGLKLEVQSVPLFIVFAIITSITFISIIQFLVTLFDNPGRFVAIIILILQLTTSAGTFPLELIPHMLQPFNAFLPMTYTVQGFKAVVSSGNIVFMWQNGLVLLGFTLASVIGTLGYFNYKHKRKFTTMQKSAA